jgi:hypothetical protein
MATVCLQRIYQNSRTIVDVGTIHYNHCGFYSVVAMKIRGIISASDWEAARPVEQTMDMTILEMVLTACNEAAHDCPAQGRCGDVAHALAG